VHTPFEIAGGTVTGQAHAAAGRNGQDAFSWEVCETGLVAVVCDGCGAAAHSEVGAQLGARLVAAAGRRLLAADPEPDAFLERLRRDVLEELRALAVALGGGDAAAAARAVRDYLLFTVVGAALGPRWAATFSLGDGLVVVNGERRELGPYPENEPPYLAYALLEGCAEARPFELHRPVPVDELGSLLLATDGALDLERRADGAVPGDPFELSELWRQDRFFRNRDAVRRRLTLARRARGGLLPDDTTVVAIRRKRAEG